MNIPAANPVMTDAFDSILPLSASARDIPWYIKNTTWNIAPAPIDRNVLNASSPRTAWLGLSQIVRVS